MILHFCFRYITYTSCLYQHQCLFVYCFVRACECRVHMYVCMFTCVFMEAWSWCLVTYLIVRHFIYWHTYFFLHWTQSSLASLAWDLCLFLLNPGIIGSRGTFYIGSRHPDSASGEASTLHTESPPQPCHLQNQDISTGHLMCAVSALRQSMKVLSL